MVKHITKNEISISDTLMFISDGGEGGVYWPGHGLPSLLRAHTFSLEGRGGSGEGPAGGDERP